jgi:DNA-binding GntR family transcriptional regulator
VESSVTEIPGGLVSSLAAAAPRYARLADTLIRDIESGRYAVGALLPSEHDLAEQYGVSRHTVREAVRRLADMGLVTRRAGVGTRVASRTAEPRYVASMTAVEDLFEYTKNTRMEVVAEEVVRADAELAAFLRCKTGQRWLRFEAVRYPRGSTQAIAYMTFYVHPAFEEIRDHLSAEGISVYRLIEARSEERMVEVHQEIEATSLTPHIASLLHAEPGTAALRVARCYLGTGDRVLTASVNVHPESRFSLRTRWRLDWEPM